MIGTKLAHYEITSHLGTGGMGEVYKATDSKLGRSVAIKRLPAAFASDPDHLSRFRREAQVLASLNHPNIAHVYGLEESGETRCIVMELVEGETLQERIKQGPVPVTEALTIAKQIVAAVEAAHEKGVVHRDLKPGNVMLTSDGRVKVLDFGLAKAYDANPTSGISANSPTLASMAATNAGVILGTAAYMAPEQARGKVVDKRADIWAFGCVLYEMLTGRQTFSGDTLSHTIVAILEHDPDWARLPASTPAGVRRLLARCLDKDPRRRLRDIGDVHVELEDTRPPIAPAQMSRSRAWIGVPVALLLLAAAGAIYAVATRDRSSRSAPRATPEAVTNDPGYTGEATLSPDGRLMAYASDRSGRGDMDLWVQQVGGGTPLRVTDDENDDHWPDFSPDGSQIVFRSERNGGGVYVVPSLGGAARLVAPGGRNPRFSPDGARIAYWTGQIRGELSGRVSETHVVSLNGGVSVRLMADFEVASAPVWSPDGKGLLVEGLRNRRQAELFDWW